MKCHIMWHFIRVYTGKIFRQNNTLVKLYPTSLDMYNGHWTIPSSLYQARRKNHLFTKMTQVATKKERVKQTVVKSVLQKNNILISQPKHMLWVFKRTVLMRWDLGSKCDKLRCLIFVSQKWLALSIGVTL